MPKEGDARAGAVGSLLAAVALIAATAWVGRKVTRSRRRKAAGRLPGASPESPLEISSFTEIDQVLGTRRCWCGGRLVLEGEGSRDERGRRYRIVRLACLRCDEDTRLYFDVTRVYH